MTRYERGIGEIVLEWWVSERRKMRRTVIVNCINKSYTWPRYMHWPSCWDTGQVIRHFYQLKFSSSYFKQRPPPPPRLTDSLTHSALLLLSLPASQIFSLAWNHSGHGRDLFCFKLQRRDWRLESIESSMESVRLCKIGSSEDVKVTLTGIY